MKSLQQQAIAEQSKALPMWKIRAALFGTQFVMIAKAGEAAMVRETWVASGIQSARYGNGDFGKLRLNADGTTSDHRYSWVPLNITSISVTIAPSVMA